MGQNITNVSASSGHCVVFRPRTPIQNVTFIAVDQFSNQRNALNGVDLLNDSDRGVLEEIWSGPPTTLEESYVLG